MKITSTGRIILSVLIIVLFTARGSNAIQACHCGTVNAELNFTNEAGSVQHYTLQKSGIAGPWTTITPTTFSLTPGQSRLVIAFTRIDCDTPEGVYGLVVKAVSAGDLITESVDYEVSSCRSVRVAQENLTYDGCVNQELVIPLTVVNDGNYLENITLSSSVGELGVDSLLIDSGDSQVVNLIVSPREVGVLPVTVNADFSDGRSRATININSIECALFEASLSSDYVSLCEDEELNIDLTVTNNGPDNHFFFNASSFFVDLPSSLFVRANQSRTQSLTVYGACESDIVNSVIQVWGNGTRILGLPLILNLRGCYQPIIVSERGSDSVCACEDVSYSFTLYNPGNRTITYALSPSMGVVYADGLVVDRVTLGVDESVDLIVNGSIPCSESYNLPLSLTATAVNACSKSATAIINLSVSSWSECESVSVEGPVAVPLNDSPFTVPVNVRNIGLRSTSYNLVVSGSAMNNLLGVSKSFLTLGPGESEVVELVLDGSNITGNFLTVQVFSLDNLASDSVVINFGGFALSDFDVYFILLPTGVIALVVIFLFRSKFFNKEKASKKDGKKK